MEYVNDKIKIVSRGLKIPLMVKSIYKNTTNPLFFGSSSGMVNYQNYLRLLGTLRKNNYAL